MATKDNFKKAMGDMFGIGGAEAKPTAAKPGKPEAKAAPAPEAKKFDVNAVRDAVIAAETQAPAAAPVQAAHAENYAVTMLAIGSAFEGKLQAKGDVELNGSFNGDVTTEGNVVLRSHMEGNLNGKKVTLEGCSLVGDVIAQDSISLDAAASIQGNLTTKSLLCAGKIVGDVEASGAVVLKSSAKLEGNLTAAALSMEEGASITGSFKVTGKESR